MGRLWDARRFLFFRETVKCASLFSVAPGPYIGSMYKCALVPRAWAQKLPLELGLA